MNPWIILIFLPLSLIFVKARHFFLISSREVKRLEAITRSPLFSLLNESLTGLATIRGFNDVNRFEAMFHECIDSNIRAGFCFLSLSR